MASQTRAVLLACGVLALGAGAAEGQQSADAEPAEQSFTVNPDLAKRGRSLFTNKGCTACHTIGKGKSAGPDLAGVTERRSLAWLERFLANPTELLETDSTAQALLAEYNNVRMPNVRLKEPEIEALLHYIAQQTRAQGG